MGLESINSHKDDQQIFWRKMLTAIVLVLVVVLVKILRQKPAPRKQASVIVDEKEGIRELNPELKIPHHLKDETLCQTLLNNFNKLNDTPLLGSHQNPQDPFQWVSNKEFKQKFTEFGSGLKKRLGIAPGDGAKVGIYSINCVEWLVSHFGLLMYKNIAVPLYSTLGEEAMVHIISNTQIYVCICFDEERAQNLLDILKGAQTKGSKALDHLKAIILMRQQSSENLKSLESKYPEIKIETMSEIQMVGREELLPYQLPEEDDLYIINFTSGSTSVPKGVEITCRMVKRMLHSLHSCKHFAQICEPDNVHLSFLPLAHVLEQITVATLLFTRGKIGFYAGRMDKTNQDLAVLKPTTIGLVPRLLVRFHDVFMKQMEKYYIPKWLIKFMIKSKLKSIEKNGALYETIWDRLIFNKTKQMLGGNVTSIFTGSAACPTEVIDFTRAAFGAVVYVGYGATEVAGPVTLSFPRETETDHVGAPIEGVQIKLGDVANMNLFPSRGDSQGRGEILVRGLNCTKRYFQEPEKTKELIDSEGWLHTGDIGEWDEYGHLKIVDRCKNIFKLSQGEYVAPEKVENIYLTCPLIDQVFVDGKSDESYAIAIVHPHLRAVSSRLGVKLALPNKTAEPGSVDVHEFCKSADVKNLVLKELTDIGKLNGLKGFEMAKKVHLIAEPMSVENKMLTSTLKMVRAEVRKSFKSEIDAMYSA